MKGVIIQARLTSTRLPRKITRQIGGISILEHLVKRAHASGIFDKVIIAAPHSPECCLNEEIFIGDENDVLDRYYQAAKKYDLNFIMRLTADCPLVPLYEMKRVMDRLMLGDTDYVTNVSHEGRFGTPDGWDVEAFTMLGLKKTWLKTHDGREGQHRSDREHVTSYMKTDKSLNPVFLEPLKLSVDAEDDLIHIREFYELERKAYLGNGRDWELRNELHQASSESTYSEGHTHTFKG